METSGPTSGIPRLPASGPATPPQWQPGQLLRATVVESDVGRALLSIGNRQVSAETSLLLQKGQELTLQVRNLGDRPVLAIVSRMADSPTAMALRLLLPRHGPVTPLLANLAQLARAASTPLPPAAAELVRALVRNLPSTATATTASGLKKAVADSGIFLERQLLASPRTTSPAADLKANLLRLGQLLRDWPDNRPQPPAARPGAASRAPAPATSAGAPLAATAEAGHRASTATPPPTQLTPGQIRRALQATGGARPSVATSPAGTTATPAPPSGRSAAASPQTAPATPLPLPLRGTVPVPQPAVKASLELLNRLATLRADLLQQTETALARIQMQQLAAQPREGERGLLEWLLDLPIRRGDDIDLWSLRIVGDEGHQAQDRQQTRRWSVQLAFDLPGLGPVQAQVQLVGEQVSARFWPERQDVLPLFNAHLHELRHALSEAGLEVADIECQPGPLRTTDSSGGPPVIDEEA